MSRVYFHTCDSDAETAELMGSERAYAGVMCTDLLAAVLDLVHPITSVLDVERYRRLLPIGAFPLAQRDDRAFMRDFAIYCMSESSNALLLVPDALLSSATAATPAWIVSVNTAIVLGSDALILLAKLHAQCEIHAYVEGPNRAWLADIIDAGLDTHVLRAWNSRSQMGWDAVATLLRRHDDTPIVLSYSVTDQFPNREAAQWAPPAGSTQDEWYDLPYEEQWRQAMAGLRAGSMGQGLEWKPETWHVGVGDAPCYSAFDIHAAWDNQAD